MNPKELTYKMPAEWESHERTFLSWPVRESMCYPDEYARVCSGYAEFVKAISEFESVSVLVNPDDQKIVRSYLSKPMKHPIEIIAVPHNDSWIRDNGPTFIKDQQGRLAGVNWRFNAWGEKYEPWDLDDAVAPVILSAMQIPCFDAPLVMEGGSFHVDGEGTLLTTEQCLLNPNRNPTMNREQIEEYLKMYINVEKVIWLKNGLSGDETDGHVDNIACFAAPGKVLIQSCEDSDDENAEITQENIRRLENSIDARGRKLEIIRIPQPPIRFERDTRLTLSYLNFYFVNQGIILPIFGGDAEETDKQALSILKDLFPNRTIRTVDGMAIIREGGNVHCSTQQMPIIEKKEDSA
ncbi:agmatine/peptidylarginine deiminase [Sporolactobacillus kofuensis]|uniref:Agmatine/peptidylarginine deiminase n=1 Tax=Sporolactobacillus kofuensis TaxID=269672 RepID=A0ABW1WGA6_9BACL|nr:agmatine deiminase family protein [Sporolactobacillus kofuensis]MCO7175345.1 agmatine deiminase family protein [Sporolactobacillus kofuensis]